MSLQPFQSTEMEVTTEQWLSTVQTQQELSPETLLLHKIADGFWSFGSIILLVIGTFGNLLSFVVMMSKQLRGSVTSVYVAVLAVADTMVLYTGLLRQWVRVVYKYDVRLVSNAGCRFHVFLVYSSVWFAIWLLVLVSIERFVSVFFPHSAKRLFTRTTAVASVIGLFVCDVIIHIFFFFVLEIRHSPVGEICDFYDPDGFLGKRVRKLWPPINIVLAFWLPSLLVLVMNVSILLRLRCPSRTAAVAPLGNAGGLTAQPRVSSMTLTLLGIAFAFLIDVTPMALYLVLEYKWPNPEPHFKAKLSLWWAIANFLMYCNSSMNFFLYVLAAPRFRRRLFEMLCFKNSLCLRPDAVNDASMALQQASSSSSRQRSVNRSSEAVSRTAVSHIQVDEPSAKCSQEPQATEQNAAVQTQENPNNLHPRSCLQGSKNLNSAKKKSPRPPYTHNA